MPFVLDASICASWSLADESSAVADLADSRLDHDSALVPRIWWYEIRNLLVVNERRQRITTLESTRLLSNLAAYPINIDTDENEQEIFRLARQHRLSFYDASYLELALRQRIPMATLDKALRAATIAEGIPLVG